MVLIASVTTVLIINSTDIINIVFNYIIYTTSTMLSKELHCAASFGIHVSQNVLSRIRYMIFHESIKNILLESSYFDKKIPKINDEFINSASNLINSLEEFDNGVIC